MKKLIFVAIFYLTYSFNSFADTSYFIDFKKVLNESKAGAAAQQKLKAKFESESGKFKKIEEDIRKEEFEIISQKKTLSPEDYQKKLNLLEKEFLIYKKINKLHLIILLNQETMQKKHC